ncbi:MAG: hypothetical protein AB1469_06100 [Pseudomonadota bacterium]
MRSIKRIGFAGLLLGALTACATQPSVKLYAGAALPSEEIAVIKNNPMVANMTARGAVLRAVDGDKLGLDISAVEVLPGAHQLDVECSFRVRPELIGTKLDPLSPIVRFTQVRQARAAFQVNVEAGRTYQLDAQFQRDFSCKPLLQDISSHNVN